jgi:membrane associated rhomboid family serine protease
MIPLQDENPSRTIPIINVSLIVANIVVFIYQYFFFSGGPERFTLQWSCIPYEFTHFVDIDPPALVPIPLTIFTSMFMHGGWLHLLGNMLFLWIFGDNVEDKLGHLRYLVFYLFCGVVASFSHIFTNLDSQIPSLGASGAISGVMGAYIFLFPGARIKTLVIWFVFIQIIRIPAVVMIGYWILIQILSGLAEFGSIKGGGIAWFAHIGGFVAGLILILLLKKRKRISVLE